MNSLGSGDTHFGDAHWAQRLEPGGAARVTFGITLGEPAPLRGRAVNGTCACTLVLASLDEHGYRCRLQADICIYTYPPRIRISVSAYLYPAYRIRISVSAYPYPRIRIRVSMSQLSTSGPHFLLKSRFPYRTTPHHTTPHHITAHHSCTL